MQTQRIRSVKIKDLTMMRLNYHWEILLESTDLKDGGDFEERPEGVEIVIISDNKEN